MDIIWLPKLKIERRASISNLEIATLPARTRTKILPILRMLKQT
jgi:hypothetical protein